MVAERAQRGREVKLLAIPAHDQDLSTRMQTNFYSGFIECSDCSSDVLRAFTGRWGQLKFDGNSTSRTIYLSPILSDVPTHIQQTDSVRSPRVIQRIFISSLILALLLQNGLAGIAYAHSSSGDSGTAVQPHVHLGGHHHHHHGHDHGHSHHHHDPQPADDGEQETPPSEDDLNVDGCEAILSVAVLDHLFAKAVSLDGTIASVHLLASRSAKTLAHLHGDLPPPQDIYLQICALLI